MRFHFLVVVLVLLLAMLMRFGVLQMVALMGCMSLVLVTEMINTALETAVDMVTQSYHPLAKLSKDIAAGAVLISAVNAALVGLYLFFGNARFGEVTRAAKVNPGPLVVMVTMVILMLVLIFIIKVMGGKGSILSGGVLSGHSAVAALLATSIIYRGHDAITGLLAVVLALLVLQSRIEGKIHTLREVILGGLLGTCLTTGIYYFAIRPH